MTSARKIKMDITVQDEKGVRRKQVVSIDKLITNLQIRVRTLEEKMDTVTKHSNTMVDEFNKLGECHKSFVEKVMKELEKE